MGGEWGGGGLGWGMTNLWVCWPGKGDGANVQHLGQILTLLPALAGPTQDTWSCTNNFVGVPLSSPIEASGVYLEAAFSCILTCTVYCAGFPVHLRIGRLVLAAHVTNRFGKLPLSCGLPPYLGCLTVCDVSF